MPAEERPKIHAWLARKQPVWLEGDLRFAKAFDEIAVSCHYKTVECATIGEYGEQLGYDAPQVRRWRDIGFVLRTEKRTERFVRTGRVALEKVVILKEIYAHPECIREGDDWLVEAENTRARALKRRIRKRIEETRQKKLVATRDLCAPVDTWGKFDRMRDLLSAKAKERLTEGETLDRLTEDGLDKHDPLRKAKRAKARASRQRKAEKRKAEKRKPAAKQTSVGEHAKSASAPPSRSRAASTKKKRNARTNAPSDLTHEVQLRADGYCEYPGCRCRTGLQRAHVHPAAAGGPWHPRNVVLLCPRHHTHFDAGRLVFLGWSEDGHPRFERRTLGRPTRTRAPPPDG